MKQSPLPRTNPCALVTVFSLSTMEPLFDFLLYGVSTSDVCTVVAGPARGQWTDEQWRRWLEDGREGRRELCGSEYVRAALRRRGLDPDDFTSSVFAVRDAASQRRFTRRRE